MDLDDEDLKATRIENGAEKTTGVKIRNLLNYWKINYGIPLFEIDKVVDYISKLEKMVGDKHKYI